ncbi:major facilitator superfamily domain-containing protein [Hyaloraphidium curvatum]|nr:major facilitator superfamily domain-containing protein [Hyaloraphidium curvatum]
MSTATAPAATSPAGVPGTPAAPAAPAPHPGDRFTDRKKAGILAIVAGASMMAIFEGAVFSPAILRVQEDLGTTEELSNLSITAYTISTAIAPLVWATLSERFGRRPIYLYSLTVAALASVALIFTQELGVAWLIVWRVFQGAGASAAFSVGAGSIADIYRVEQRGRAMGVFSLGPLLGALAGPPIGGVLAQTVGWRFIFVVIAGITVFLLSIIFFLLPETLPPRAEGAKAPRINPVAMFPQLRYGFVLVPVAAQSLTWGALYAQSSMMARQMNAAYGWNSAQVGLFGLIPAAGNIAGGLLGGTIADRFVNRPHPGKPPKLPETRLYVLFFAVTMSFVGLTSFGWIVETRAPWAAGIPFQLIWGFGMLSAMVPSSTYLVDLYRTQAASMSAVSSLVRLTVAALAPVAAPAMERTMGTGGMYTFWGGLLVVVVVPGAWWLTTRGWKYRLSVGRWAAEVQPAAKGATDEEMGLKDGEAKVGADGDGDSAATTDTTEEMLAVEIARPDKS